MTDTQQKFLWTQQAVGIVLNALISALFVWLVFGDMERVGLWGSAGLAADLVPTTFMITMMMTFGITRLTRSAAGSGQVQALGGRSRLPKNLLLRGPVLALLATLVLVPLSVAPLASMWTRDWTYGEVLWFKIAYGIALGLIVTPVIIMAALRDGAAPATST